MSRIDEQFYVGEGSILIRKKGQGGEFRELGNVTAFKTAFETSTETLRSGKKGGGNAARTDKIVGVTTEFTLNDLRPDNLALITNGQAFEDVATPVTDEPHVAVEQELIVFDKFPDMAQPVVVKNDAGDTTYDEGVHYVLGDQGIEVLAGAGIAFGDALKISYTTAVVDRVEMLTAALGENYEIIMDGLNAENGKPVRLTLHNHKFALADELDWLNETYAEVTVSGECLADATKSGAGISKFLKQEVKK